MGALQSQLMRTTAKPEQNGCTEHPAQFTSSSTGAVAQIQLKNAKEATRPLIFKAICAVLLGVTDAALAGTALILQLY